MGKKNRVIEIPTSDEMSNEQFLLHLEKRHAAEVKIEDYTRLHAVEAWIGTYRAFHDRIHSIAMPGQYDHVHVEEEDE